MGGLGIQTHVGVLDEMHGPKYDIAVDKVPAGHVLARDGRILVTY